MESKWEVRTRNVFADGQWRFDRKYERGEHIVEFSGNPGDTIEFDGEPCRAIFLCGSRAVILANPRDTMRIEIELLKKFTTHNS